MIAYLDSSVLVRAYLSDERDHGAARQLLENEDVALVTGGWTRIEVSGALVGAARAHRGDASSLLSALDDDLALGGPVSVIAASQAEVEALALQIVRRDGIRAMDAWHLATARVILPALADPGEEQSFATRDEDQARVAAALGFTLL